MGGKEKERQWTELQGVDGTKEPEKKQTSSAIAISAAAIEVTTTPLSNAFDFHQHQHLSDYIQLAVQGTCIHIFIFILCNQAEFI